MIVESRDIEENAMAVKKTISRAVLKQSVLLIAILVIPLGALLLLPPILRFQQDILNYERTYTEQIKQTTKGQIEHAIVRLSFDHMKVQERMRTMLQEQVYIAHAIATELYNQNKNKVTGKELRSMVREALRVIRYNSNRGYFFATDLNGIEQLFADRPEMEGKNLLEMRDTTGKFVIRDMIDIAKSEAGEGFYGYTWSKPESEGKGYQKLSFIKYFEPLDWFIGTGEYIDEVEAQVQAEAAEWLDHVRYGKDNYLFAFKYGGTYVAHVGKNIKNKAADANYWDLKDVNGVLINQELQRQAQRGGGFIEYVWYKPSTGMEVRKLAYAKAFEPWGWVVGTGVYMDDIEAGIAEKRAELWQTTWENILVLSIILILALLIALLITIRFSNNLQKELNVFRHFFRKAGLEAKPIAVDQLRYDGFRALAEAGNDMLAKGKAADQEKQRLLAAIEQSAEVVVVTDLSGAIQYVNPAFEKVTGYSAKEAIGQNPRILKSGKHDQQFYRNLWKTIRNGDVWKGKFVNKRKNGTEYNEEATISPVLNKKGEIVNYVAIKKDVTQKLVVEAQLQQALKMEAIGRLAGGVAHDFNNLLTGITGNIQLALMDANPDDPIVDMLTEVNKAAESAASLTRQLLAFSRKQIIDPKIINMNNLIEHLHKMLVRLIGEDVNLTFIPMEPLGCIKADPGQVEQILVNLAVNARDAMPNGGKLTIETADVDLGEDYCRNYPHIKPGKYVMLAVTDDGIGIDEETRRNIFEPFFTTKDKNKGTGLGLATIYGIVKQHGGYIEVYSELGIGSTFKVFFPLVRERTQVGKRGLGIISDLPCGTETILVVEDESMVRNIAVKVLQRQGYNVVQADNGPNALSYCEKHSIVPDLLMTDIVMPAMNGRDLAESFLARHPDIKVLFTSGYTENVIAHHNGELEEGLNFIGKPYTPQDLVKKIRNVLDGSRS